MAELDIKIGTDRVLGKSHSSLENLDYESSGHTGFQKAEEGKGLSTNDFSNEYRAKLEGLQNYDDTELRNTIASKQEALVSGTNIKTINNQSILGSGNITIEGGGGSSESLTLIEDEEINIWELVTGKYITNGDTTISYHSDDKGTVSTIEVGAMCYIVVDKPSPLSAEGFSFGFTSYYIREVLGSTYDGAEIFMKPDGEDSMYVGELVVLHSN